MRGEQGSYCARHLTDGGSPRVRGEQNDAARRGWLPPGSSPRAREADDRLRLRRRGGRITPACAGSSLRPTSGSSPPWDHPRVRGEQNPLKRLGGTYPGSPPRARGAGGGGPLLVRRKRITPACAGSRAGPGTTGHAGTDHPRVRGEQEPPAVSVGREPGSPPRARGAGHAAVVEPRARRITPACAGSRILTTPAGRVLADHPRVRGEQECDSRCSRRPGGSPPRARGAEQQLDTAVGQHRITPACAGSSALVLLVLRHCADHPRVRGEQQVGQGPCDPEPGSPPRARGADLSRHRDLEHFGITPPACAGSSRSAPWPAPRQADHPRVRGEQVGGRLVPPPERGSPPRARGADTTRVHPGRERGITPACAGSRRRIGSTRTKATDHPRVRGEQETETT